MSATGVPVGAACAPTRQRRITLPGIVVALVVVLVVVLLGVRSLDSARTAVLDPENSRPDGARAVAQVLDDLGVDVTVARGRAALDEALDPVDEPTSTTVVVTSSNQLGPSTLDHLHSTARDHVDRVVHVDPTAAVVAHLGGGTAPRPVAVTASLPAACAGPYAGLTLAVTRASVVGQHGCFETDHGPALAEAEAGAILFGAGQALQNGRITEGDNAAVALRLLGTSDRLVWYVPEVTDLDADETTGDVLPPWTGPVLWLLLVAGAALVVWRGRRLGRLAVEPLPVVVDAIETTAGRGRLLRRGKDRAHAAAVLRASAAQRLAEHLQVPPDDLRTLVTATATRTGRTPDALTTLLSPDARVPHDDAALVRLGQELTALTEEVRHA